MLRPLRGGIKLLDLVRKQDQPTLSLLRIAEECEDRCNFGRQLAFGLLN
jgi:hypothetical protein